MKKLPIILFVAPRSTYDEAFKKAIEGWASIVYFDSGRKAEDKKQHINLDQLGREQERKMAAVEAAAPARKPRP